MYKQAINNIPFMVPDMLQTISPLVKTPEDLFNFCSSDNPDAKFPEKEKEQKRFGERIAKDFLKTHQFSILSNITTKERNKRMMNGLPLKRRIDATVEFLPELETRFGKKFCDIPYQTEFMNYSLSLPFSSPNQCNDYFSVNYAIAIWIMDAITHTDDETMTKFDCIVRGAYYDFQDEDNSVLEDPDFFCDSLHDPMMLRDLVCILNHRNSGTKDGGEGDMFFYNLCMAKRTEPYQSEGQDDEEDSTSARTRFEMIMELIPNDMILSAISSFEENLWLSVEHYLEDYRERYWLPLKDLAETGIKISDEIERLDKARETREKNVGNALLYKPDKSNISVMVGNLTPFDNSVSSYRNNDDFKTNRFYRKLVENVSDMERMLVELQSFRFASAAPHFNALTRISFGGKRVLSGDTKVMNLPMKNPYEICFALLYLLENGSSLPWLYTYAFIVLDNAVARLPWTRSVDRIKRVLVNGYDPRLTEVGSLYEDPHTSTIYYKDLDNGSVYDLRFSNGVDEFDEKFSDVYGEDLENYEALVRAVRDLDEFPIAFNLNLTQIVFNNTDNYIMPRELNEENLIDAKEINDVLKRSRITGSDANFTRRLLQMAAFASWKQSWALNGYGEAIADFEDDEFDLDSDEDLMALFEENLGGTDEEQELSGEMNEELLSELKESNASLSAAKEEIKQLKAELWQAKRDLSDRESAWTEERKEADQNKQELNDLREIVFNKENEISEEDDMEEVSDVSFPYSMTDKKIVSFGGHDTWFRAIKGMFDNVVFIDRDRIPDENLIKNADCVWIQWNNLKHKHYYKIINCARANRIPVRYFKYASPQKCAFQLVEYDREG